MKNTHRYFCQAPSHQFIFFEKPQFEPQNPDKKTTEETKELSKSQTLNISETAMALLQDHKGIQITKNTEKKTTTIQFPPNYSVIKYRKGGGTPMSVPKTKDGNPYIELNYDHRPPDVSDSIENAPGRGSFILDTWDSSVPLKF